MNTERINQEIELTIEVEELEAKIVPQASSTYLD